MPNTAQQEYIDQLTAARIDELMPYNAENEAPYGFVSKELEFAADFILQNAPRHMVYNAIADGSFMVGTPTEPIDTILLDIDFLRFVRLKMTQWKRAIDSIVDIDTLDYRRQSFNVSMGSNERPVAALVPSATAPSKKALELYPEGDLEEFLYIPQIHYSEMDPALIDSMTWYAGSRVLSSLQQPNAAKIAFDNMRQLLGEKYYGFKEEKTNGGDN